MEAIEKNLKEICRRKGLSLTDVANRMATSPSNLLSSVKGNPTVSKIQDIANALQVSVSELLTMRPEKATGIAFIEGKVYQISKPAANVVQLPVYERYDDLRDAIRVFVEKAIEKKQNDSMMGMVESFEVFSLLYDAHDPCFFVSLCYADGRMMTFSYHKLEYGDWKNEETGEVIEWDIQYLTEDIINDIEGAVPQKLQSL